MNTHKKIFTMILSGLLIAIGIVIPIISPIKVTIGPMSFTLASHVAIMTAIFISPQVAVAVALGTTLGFIIAGFPFVVALRALSHSIWAFLGASYVKKNPDLFKSPVKAFTFNLVIAILHGIGEILVVIPFFIGTSSVQSLIYSVGFLVGIGTILHSSIDFTLSLIAWKILSKNKKIANVSNVKQVYLIKNV